MFKGFDKAKDIQYVYTPVFSSLCGVKLDSNNKAGYLLSGTVCNETFLYCALKEKTSWYIGAVTSKERNFPKWLFFWE